MRPAFHVLTLLYAPPGINGGKSTSMVDYGGGSTTGTTTSTSSSFKVGVDVSASASGSLGSASSDFKYSTTSTDTSSVEIKKSESYEIRVTDPAVDGIDHDLDVFYLWLNPLLDVTVDREEQSLASRSIRPPLSPEGHAVVCSRCTRNAWRASRGAPREWSSGIFVMDRRMLR